jgi:hypothetical protein
VLADSTTNPGIYVAPLVGGLILYAIIRSVVRAPGASLASKFKAQGTLQGRTKQDIIATVGPPQAVSAVAGGKTLLQWQATGYHIALRFDENDLCEGVTHEFRSR